MRAIKGRVPFIARLIAFILAGFAAIGSAGATSANTDVSDLWWNPDESGWGIQLVNTGTFVFATLYIYGADGTARWVVASLDKTNANPPTFTGPLYATAGPPFNNPNYDPKTVVEQQVGTMTFVLTSVNTGQLSYSIAGAPVSKSVQRQPLTLDNYNGTFASVLTLNTSGCTDPANNNKSSTGTLLVTTTQNEATMSQSWNFLDSATAPTICTYNGTYSQLGRMGQFTSTWTCPTGGSGTMTMYQMTNEPNTFMARVNVVNTASSSGCKSDGEIVGVIPRP
jgi:hypothetical protein